MAAKESKENISGRLYNDMLNSIEEQTLILEEMDKALGVNSNDKVAMRNLRSALEKEITEAEKWNDMILSEIEDLEFRESRDRAVSEAVAGASTSVPVGGAATAVSVARMDMVQIGGKTFWLFVMMLIIVAMEAVRMVDDLKNTR